LNQYGSTAVHQAALAGHASVVTLLLDANTDVHHTNMVRDAFFHDVVLTGQSVDH
jgi:ankyrin repeat protein